MIFFLLLFYYECFLTILCSMQGFNLIIFIHLQLKLIVVNYDFFSHGTLQIWQRKEQNNTRKLLPADISISMWF